MEHIDAMVQKLTTLDIKLHSSKQCSYRWIAAGVQKNTETKSEIRWAQDLLAFTSYRIQIANEILLGDYMICHTICCDIIF